MPMLGLLILLAIKRQRMQGRLTLNPLKHLDPVGTLLLIFAGFGWAKPVPINPYYFQGNRKKKVLAVSVAGPLMNLLEAVVGAAILFLLLHLLGNSSSKVSYYLILFFYYYVQINVVLAIFNLLPPFHPWTARRFLLVFCRTVNTGS